MSLKEPAFSADKRPKRPACQASHGEEISSLIIKSSGEITTRDGKRLKLADLFFPLDREDGKIHPTMLQFVKDVLGQNALRALQIAKTDRYRRAPVYLFIFRKGKGWQLLQEILIAHNYAVFMPEPQGRTPFKLPCNSQTLRTTLLNHNSHGHHATNGEPGQNTSIYEHDDPDLNRLSGEFVFVKGIITAVRETKRGISFNFGSNWRNDFTAYLSRSATKSLKGDEKNNSLSVGKQVLLRGYLDFYYGPAMRVDHLMQMEVINE